jgi:hypothetical protein
MLHIPPISFAQFFFHQRLTLIPYRFKDISATQAATQDFTQVSSSSQVSNNDLFSNISQFKSIAQMKLSQKVLLFKYILFYMDFKQMDVIHFIPNFIGLLLHHYWNY